MHKLSLLIFFILFVAGCGGYKIKEAESWWVENEADQHLVVYCLGVQCSVTICAFSSFSLNIHTARCPQLGPEHCHRPQAMDNAEPVPHKCFNKLFICELQRCLESHACRRRDPTMFGGLKRIYIHTIRTVVHDTTEMMVMSSRTS